MPAIYITNIHIITHISILSVKLLYNFQLYSLLPFTIRSSKANKTTHHGKKKKTADVYPVSAAFPTSVAIALFTDDVAGGVPRGMCEPRSVRLFRTLVWSAFRYHGTRTLDGVSVWQGDQLVWRSSVTAKHVVQNNYSPYHLYADNLVELVSCSLRPHPSLQVTIVSLSQPRHWNFPRITRYQADIFC